MIRGSPFPQSLCRAFRKRQALRPKYPYLRHVALEIAVKWCLRFPSFAVEFDFSRVFSACRSCFLVAQVRSYLLRSRLGYNRKRAKFSRRPLRGWADQAHHWTYSVERLISSSTKSALPRRKLWRCCGTWLHRIPWGGNREIRLKLWANNFSG